MAKSPLNANEVEAGGTALVGQSAGDTQCNRPLFPQLLTSLFIALVMLLIPSCASTESGEPVDLAFLRDGQTTRGEVTTNLGGADATFQDQNILTYCLGSHTKAGYTVPDLSSRYRWGGMWYGIKYNLVLVFDDGGILRRHSVVKIK